MSQLNYNVPPSPPPPSYEISQHEFDQKTSQVLERSAAEPPQPRVDEDGFEVWDDAVFEAALVGMNDMSLGGQSSHSRSASSSQPQPQASFSGASSGSSSLSSPPPFSPDPRYGSRYPQEKARGAEFSPERNIEGASGSRLSAGSSAAPSFVSASPPQSVRPLAVKKKSRPAKERPAWYAEAGLGGAAGPPDTLSAPQASSSSTRQEAPLRRQLTVFNADREGTPPPEFSAIGPSLDGPPYEGPPYETIVMAPLPAGSSIPNTPEPPAFSTPPPPAVFATPQPQVLARASPAPPSRPGSTRPHGVHAQSLPPNPHASSRPHAVHHQSTPSTSSSSTNSQYGAGFRASAFEPQAGGKMHNGPRLSFNPQMAYAKPAAPATTAYRQAEDVPPENVDASAFYSHAVSAQYSFNVPARMRRQSVASSVQSNYSQQYPPPGIPAPPPNGLSVLNADKGVAPVVSPRPSYAYGQAKFQEPSYQPGGAWGYTNQQQWPAGGGSQVYR